MTKNLKTSAANELLVSIEDCSAHIGIVGLGYVGQSLLEIYLRVGFRTTGFDTDGAKVERIKFTSQCSKHFNTHPFSKTKSAQLEATSELDQLNIPDVLVISVPTPLDGEGRPDLQHVVAAATSVSKVCRPGQLICLESTTYPGTTREVFSPIIAKSGMKIGRDIFVAYSSERVDPGSTSHPPSSIPKVVGANDPLSLKVATSFYKRGFETIVQATSCEVAEASKILENTYRCVNVALVNELKMTFEKMGINIWEVIDAARTKPFGFQSFSPGPGLGGHCIPVDPVYLSWIAREHQVPTQLTELALEINSSMPRYVLSRIADALNSENKTLFGSKVCVLGVSYKKDVSDLRESPALELIKSLRRENATVSYSDPYVTNLGPPNCDHDFEIESSILTDEFLMSQDCTVVVTDHSAFDWNMIVANSSLVVDTRNATNCVSLHRDRIWLA